MRIVLVGPEHQRRRWRRELVNAGLEIAGEFETLGDGRASAGGSDAILLLRDARERELTVASDGMEPLTERELEVLELLSRGLPNKAIAARLAISDQTAKFHVASIIGKLGAANRTDAVRRGLHRGLISL